MAIKQWEAGEVLTAGDLNSAFASCVATDTQRVVIVTHDWRAPQDFAAGSESAPGLYLNGDVDTGLYEIAAGRWGWSSGGNRIIEFSASGIAVSNIAATGDGSFGTLGVTGSATFSGGVSVTANGPPKVTLSHAGVPYRGRFNFDANGAFWATNALFKDGAWTRDDDSSMAFAIAQHMGSGRYEFRIAPPGSGPISWTTVFTANTHGEGWFSGPLAWGGGNPIASSNDVLRSTGANTFSGLQTLAGGVKVGPDGTEISRVRVGSYTFTSDTTINTSSPITVSISVPGAAMGSVALLAVSNISVDPSFLNMEARVINPGIVTVSLLALGTNRVIAEGGKLNVVVIEV